MARRYFKHAYSVGMESEELQAEETAQAEQEAQGAGAETLETELIEVNDSATEGDAREEALDEADEVVEELAEDKQELEVASESGGIDHFAASILRRKIDNRLATIGISPLRMPATESFGSASGRLGATQVAIEAIGEKIKEIWRAIVAAIKKAAKWVRDHFNKVFGAQEKLKKRAEALGQRAENTTGKAKESKIENDRIFNALAINKEIKPDMGDFFDVSEKVYANIEKSVSAAKTLGESFRNADKIETEFLSNHVNTYLGSLTNGLTINQSVHQDQTSGVANVTDNASAELPGGRVIVRTTPASNTIKGARLALFQKDPKAKAVEGKKFNVLPISSCVDLCENVGKLADQAIQARKGFDKIAEAKEALAKGLDNLDSYVASLESYAIGLEEGETTEDTTTTNTTSNNGGTGNNNGGTGSDDNKPTEREKFNSLKSAVQVVEKLIDKFPAAYATYALSTGKTILDYVELSLKQYSN